MRNRGIGRARMFVGGFLLTAAVIVAAIGMWMSPHSESVAEGTEHVSKAIVVYARNSALATLVLAALAAFFLYPLRRPPMPKRDWALAILIAILVVSSFYQLIWLRTAVVPEAQPARISLGT